jgi:hypothetical protein
MARPKDLGREHTWRLRLRRQAASGLSIAVFCARSSGHNSIPPGDSSWTVRYSHRSEHGRGANRPDDNCHWGGLYCQACWVSGSRAPKTTDFGTPLQSNRIPLKRPRKPSHYPSRNQRPRLSPNRRVPRRTGLSVGFGPFATGRPRPKGGAARCRPDFPIGIGTKAKNRAILNVGSVVLISQPRFLHFTLNHYKVTSRIALFRDSDHSSRR